MKKLDMTIVTPSRRRTHNMGTLRLLLPTARVCVDEREFDDYAAVVPPTTTDTSKTGIVAMKP